MRLVQGRAGPAHLSPARASPAARSARHAPAGPGPGQPGQGPRLHDGRHHAGHARLVPGQIGAGPGGRGGLRRIAVVQRHERLADGDPCAQVPVPGLVGSGPRGAEEGPGHAMVTDIDHGHAGQPGQPGRQAAEPLHEFQRLALLTHAPDVAEIEEHVAEQPHGRHRHVLPAVLAGHALPVVQHRHRDGRAEQRLVQAAADPLDRTEEPAVRRGARVRHQAQQRAPHHVVIHLPHAQRGGVGGLRGAPDGRPGNKPGRCGPGRRHRHGTRQRR